MKKILSILYLLFTGLVSAQNCEINKDNYGLLNVSKKDIKCLAKGYEGYTLVYTFGMWCQPCIVHLKDVIDLTEKHNLNLLILAVDRNKTNYLHTKKYIDSKKKGIIVMSLNSIYGKNENKKYKKFISEITPNNFEDINDMSKYILLNKQGEVLMVTSYKDRLKDESWEDDKPMLKRKITPFLIKQ